jgi:hypothetical protein
MEREFIDCKHAMKPTCPYSTHEFMLSLFAGNGISIKEFSEETIKNANSLCSNCEEFTAKSH